MVRRDSPASQFPGHAKICHHFSRNLCAGNEDLYKKCVFFLVPDAVRGGLGSDEQTVYLLFRNQTQIRETWRPDLFFLSHFQ